MGFPIMVSVMGFPIMVSVAVVVVTACVALMVFNGRRGCADGRGWWNESSLYFGGLLALVFLGGACTVALDLVAGWWSLPPLVFPVTGCVLGAAWFVFAPIWIRRFLARRRGGC